MIGISVREFARRDGCSHTLVNRAIKEGHLRKFEDGSLDPSLAGTGWRSSNRRAVGAETIEQLAERAIAEAVVIPSIADSEAKKEYYLAELRRLEYDVKSGYVAPVSEQIALVTAAFSRVRQRLLALAAEAAPALHRCKTPAEVEAEVRRRVVEALEELAGAAGG